MLSFMLSSVADYGDGSDGWAGIERFFLTAFTVELFLNILAYGLKLFFAVEFYCQLTYD